MLPDDEDEFSFRRPEPSAPYQRSSRLMLLPQGFITALGAVFGPYARQRLEACCFLFGERRGTTSAVKAIVIPSQRNHWGNYSVSAESTREMAFAVMERGLSYLAQIHTHPGSDVEHSRYDDAHANSTRGLSLVLPWYGVACREWPDGIGVHEFQNGYWYLVDAEVAPELTRLDETLPPAEILDLR